MTDTPRRFYVGPSRSGLWIVRDARGLCGGVFNSREKAVSFAKAECAGAGEWRVVKGLEMGALFVKG